MATTTNRCARQAQLTFAISRHAVVDLAQIYSAPPRPPREERLTPEIWKQMQDGLRQAGWTLEANAEGWARLQELRGRYEPYVNALAERLCLAVPPWIGPRKADAWQTSAWERSSSMVMDGRQGQEGHF